MLNGDQMAVQIYESDEILEWQNLVGLVILSFGDIEAATVRCLAHIPNDRISRTTSKLSFSQRIELLLEILEGRTGKSALVTTLIQQFTKVAALTWLRNLIAHNPLQFDVYLDEATDDVRFESVIRSVRASGKSLSLDELRQKAMEVRDLAVELYTTLSAIEKASKNDPNWFA